MQKKVWEIEAIIKKTYKISFDESVDRDEAIEMFEVKEYKDIVEESEEFEIIEVVDAQ